MNYSRRNPKRTAKHAYHTGISVCFIARAGTSCIKKEVRISNSSIIRWTFFQFRSSRKDDLTDIDMVKNPGDREILFGQPVEEEVQGKVLPRNS